MLLCHEGIRDLLLIELIKQIYRMTMYDRPMGQNLFATEEEKLESVLMTANTVVNKEEL
jgi:hypothetical protein